MQTEAPGISDKRRRNGRSMTLLATVKEAVADAEVDTSRMPLPDGLLLSDGAAVTNSDERCVARSVR